jgi:DNA-binding XRE family transcriptional regulator
MTVSFDERMRRLPPTRRARIEARTTKLIEQELTLRDLRQAEHMTQEHMAEQMGMAQENVSRLERRADLLLSTLSSYVAAMGGKLRLLAEFPNRSPVAITLGDITEHPPLKPRRKSKTI